MRNSVSLTEIASALSGVVRLLILPERLVQRSSQDAAATEAYELEKSNNTVASILGRVISTRSVRRNGMRE